MTAEKKKEISPYVFIGNDMFNLNEISAIETYNGCFYVYDTANVETIVTAVDLSAQVKKALTYYGFVTLDKNSYFKKSFVISITYDKNNGRTDVAYKTSISESRVTHIKKQFNPSEIKKFFNL